jgi:hypothetical protein
MAGEISRAKTSLCAAISGKITMNINARNNGRFANRGGGFRDRPAAALRRTPLYDLGQTKPGAVSRPGANRQFQFHE